MFEGSGSVQGVGSYKTMYLGGHLLSDTFAVA